MKKLLAITISVLLVMTLFVSCKANKAGEPINATNSTKTTQAAGEETVKQTETETTVPSTPENTTYDDRLPTEAENKTDAPTKAPSVTEKKRDPKPGRVPDVTNVPATTAEATISEEKAKAVVLAHAGLAESEVSRYHIERDRERGTLVYEIEFNSGKYEYDYEVNAENGKIIRSEKEYRD